MQLFNTDIICNRLTTSTMEFDQEAALAPVRSHALYGLALSLCVRRQIRPAKGSEGHSMRVWAGLSKKAETRARLLAEQRLVQIKFCQGTETVTLPDGQVTSVGAELYGTSPSFFAEQLCDQDFGPAPPPDFTNRCAPDAGSSGPLLKVWQLVFHPGCLLRQCLGSVLLLFLQDRPVGGLCTFCILVL